MQELTLFTGETALDKSEIALMEECEVTIERGLRTFHLAGQALMCIRDHKLYRDQYRTFDEYCNDRWNFRRAQAYRLIDAATVIENLSPMGDKTPGLPLPETERQIRELKKLPAEQQPEVWEEAVKTAPETGITAKHVRATVARMTATQEQDEQVNDLAPVNKMTVHHSSDSPEWYTPKDIIDRAILVMGEITIDPCSNSIGPPNVPAVRRYTQKDNGLKFGWNGCIFLNPPYGEEIGIWTEKLDREYENGGMCDAIALVPARTDTRWFQALLSKYRVCFITGRLKFIRGEGGPAESAPFPSAVFYLGNKLDAFEEHFGPIGLICRCLKGPGA